MVGRIDGWRSCHGHAFVEPWPEPTRAAKPRGKHMNIQTAGLPSGLNPPSLRRFPSFASTIEGTRPANPVYVLHPKRFRTAVSRFLDSFPGTTMYAVKANPVSHVVDMLWEAGIRHFDTASLAEIELIRSRYPESTCHFMAPVRIPGEA